MTLKPANTTQELSYNSLHNTDQGERYMTNQTEPPTGTKAVLCRTDPMLFMATASKPNAVLAGEMADEIKAIIYAYEQRIPLALAIGVLRIVEKEILDSA